MLSLPNVVSRIPIALSVPAVNVRRFLPRVPDVRAPFYSAVLLDRHAPRAVLYPLIYCVHSRSTRLPSAGFRLTHVCAG